MLTVRVDLESMAEAEIMCDSKTIFDRRALAGISLPVVNVNTGPGRQRLDGFPPPLTAAIIHYDDIVQPRSQAVYNPADGRRIIVGRYEATDLEDVTHADRR